MNRKGSIGSTMIVLQEQLNHQKRLDIIYNRSKPPHNSATKQSSSYSQHHSKYSKRDRYEDQQHLKTIQKLFETLNRGKTMADRYKDPHDFYAYPAFFFRDTLKKASKDHTKGKNHKKKMKTVPHLSQDSQRFSQQKIRQFLPVLTNFEQSDFQEFTDGINKIIISFDITTRKELHLLEQKVTNLLPNSCPDDFLQAISVMFRQIQQEMQE